MVLSLSSMPAFKSTAVVSLFLALNLLFFTTGDACGTCPPYTPTPVFPTPTPVVPTPTPVIPTPMPKPKPKPKPSPSCPVDTLKFGACSSVLGGLINLELGKPPKKPCCSLIGGLADTEAAVCLCTAFTANVLGANLNIPVDLSLLINYCGKKVPKGFQCP